MAFLAGRSYEKSRFIRATTAGNPNKIWLKYKWRHSELNCTLSSALAHFIALQTLGRAVLFVEKLEITKKKTPEDKFYPGWHFSERNKKMLPAKSQKSTTQICVCASKIYKRKSNVQC